jgi:hypothetical protein
MSDKFMNMLDKFMNMLDMIHQHVGKITDPRGIDGLLGSDGGAL